MELIPFSNLRSTLMFMAILLTGCGLFAMMADAFVGGDRAALAANSEDPAMVAGAQDVPVIAYEEDSGAILQEWYDEEPAFETAEPDEALAADDFASTDPFSDAGAGQSDSWTQDQPESNAGTINNAARVE